MPCEAGEELLNCLGFNLEHATCQSSQQRPQYWSQCEINPQAYSIIAFFALGYACMALRLRSKILKTGIIPVHRQKPHSEWPNHQKKKTKNQQPTNPRRKFAGAHTYPAVSGRTIASWSVKSFDSLHGFKFQFLEFAHFIICSYKFQ